MPGHDERTGDERADATRDAGDESLESGAGLVDELGDDPEDDGADDQERPTAET
jgi:hypothetical protein